MRPFFSAVCSARTRRVAVLLLGVPGALPVGIARGASTAPALSGIVVRHASQILAEPDGKIIAVGEPSADGTPLALVQFRANGKVDRAFNASGLGLLALDSIVQAPGGEFLLAGSFADAAGNPMNRLVKLQSDGSIDTGFNAGTAFAADPVVQKDGHILLLGSVAGTGGVSQPTLIRLHPNGKADTSFRPGVELLPGSVYNLRLQPDGGLLLIGRNGASTGQQSLQRLESNGTLDRQFHAAAPIANGYGVCALASTPSGKLLVAEYADAAADACTVSRLEADGSLDPGFQAAVPVQGNVARLEEDQAGRVVLSGAFSGIDGVAEPGFARLTKNGQVDPRFDPLGTSDTGVYGFVVDPYGTVTFAFPSGSDGPPSTVVETYSADGSAVNAFVVEPCPSCELVPAPNGQGVYVRVISNPTPPATAP